MAKNKNNQAIWNTRIKKKASTLFETVGSSINIDKRLYKEDIALSIAYTKALVKINILTSKEQRSIERALKSISNEIWKT